MTPELFESLLAKAKPYYPSEDPSHDWNHICRVFAYAHKLHAAEGGDLDIIAAGVLFHDCVNLPKNHPESHKSADMSAKVAQVELAKISDFPQEKIPAVMDAINEHSFSKALKPTTLESAIVQDSDRLESTGIIALMRTFASCGSMGRPIFNWQDPFCENRQPDPKNYGFDLIYSRLLEVSKYLNTDSAKEIAKDSDQRIREFINLFEEDVQHFPTTTTHWTEKLIDQTPDI